MGGLVSFVILTREYHPLRITDSTIPFLRRTTPDTCLAHEARRNSSAPPTLLGGRSLRSSCRRDIRGPDVSPSTGNILIVRLVHGVHLGIAQAHDQRETIFRRSLRQTRNGGSVSLPQTPPGLRLLGKGLCPFPFLAEENSLGFRDIRLRGRAISKNSCGMLAPARRSLLVTAGVGRLCQDTARKKKKDT